MIMKHYLGGKIEFKISSVCWLFFESRGWSFFDWDDGLPIGRFVSIGTGEVDLRDLAFYDFK